MADISIEKRLSDWLHNFLSSKQESTKAAGPVSKWWSYIAIGFVSCIILAILAYFSWAKGKELAILKHQVDLDKAEKEKLEVTKQIEKEDIKKKELQEKVKKLEESINITESEIRLLDRQNENVKSDIDKLKNWDDLDNFIKK